MLNNSFPFLVRGLLVTIGASWLVVVTDIYAFDQCESQFQEDDDKPTSSLRLSSSALLKLRDLNNSHFLKRRLEFSEDPEAIKVAVNQETILLPQPGESERTSQTLIALQFAQAEMFLLKQAHMLIKRDLAELSYEYGDLLVSTRDGLEIAKFDLRNHPIKYKFRNRVEGENPASEARELLLKHIDSSLSKMESELSSISDSFESAREYSQQEKKIADWAKKLEGVLSLSS